MRRGFWRDLVSLVEILALPALIVLMAACLALNWAYRRTEVGAYQAGAWGCLITIMILGGVYLGARSRRERRDSVRRYVGGHAGWLFQQGVFLGIVAFILLALGWYRSR